MRTIKKFFSLTPADRGLVLDAGFWVALVRVGLRLASLQTLRRALARIARTRGAINPVRAVEPERIAWAVRAASQYVPNATCLTQALAAQIMLARHGYPANLRIGVALGERNTLHAHAWVESDGTVLIGGGAMLEQLTPLANFET